MRLFRSSCNGNANESCAHARPSITSGKSARARDGRSGAELWLDGVEACVPSSQTVYCNSRSLLAWHAFAGRAFRSGARLRAPQKMSGGHPHGNLNVIQTMPSSDLRETIISAAAAPASGSTRLTAPNSALSRGPPSPGPHKCLMMQINYTVCAAMPRLIHARIRPLDVTDAARSSPSH